jgi:hypothetical protein
MPETFRPVGDDLPPDSPEIEHRPGLSPAEFAARYYNPGKPVVAGGATAGWAAHAKWTPAYLATLAGDRKVRVAGKDYRFRDFLDEAVQSTDAKPGAYLNEVSLHRTLPELLPDVQPPLALMGSNRLQSRLLPRRMRHELVELLIGGKGTRFPGLHYDGYHHHTFVTQIRGDKLFLFYPPEQTPYMYPVHPHSNRSQVNDAFHPDLERFPLFANSKPFTTVVREGETAFIPGGWWHTTRLLGLSIAISVNSVNRKMWNTYVDDVVRDRPGALKREMLRAFLKTTGLFMTVGESLSGKPA